MVNSTLSSLMEQEFHKNYKRTWQGVPNIFLYYMYVIVLVLFTMFQTDNIISCDISCDYGHILFHCPRNKRKRKSQIKEK